MEGFKIILGLLSFTALSSLFHVCEASMLDNKHRYIWATVHSGDKKNAFEAWVPFTDLAGLFLETNQRSEWFQDTNGVLHSPPHKLLGEPREAFYAYKHNVNNNVISIVEVCSLGIRVWAEDRVFISAKVPENLDHFTVAGYIYQRLPSRPHTDIPHM